MPDTPSSRFAVERPADNDIIKGWPAEMRDAIDQITALMAAVITTTPRPAAGTFGRFHRAADGTISFDTGASWVTIARHPHAAEHQPGGIDPLTVTAAMLASDVPTVNVGDIIPTARQNLPANGRFAWANGGTILRSAYPEFFAAVGLTYSGGADPGGDATLIALPDLRGRTLVGVDGTANRLTGPDTMGASGGEERHQLTAAELASHAHADGTLATAGAGSHAHTLAIDGSNIWAPGWNVVIHDSSWTAAAGTFQISPPGPWIVPLMLNGSNMSYTSGTHTHTGVAQAVGDHVHDVVGSTANAGGDAAHNTMQPYQIVNYLVRIL